MADVAQHSGRKEQSKQVHIALQFELPYSALLLRRLQQSPFKRHSYFSTYIREHLSAFLKSHICFDMEDNMKANSGSPMPNRKKYRHQEYEDGQIDALMRYFKFENYGTLEWFLRSVKKER